MQLALGRVSSCPFADDEIRHLKEEVIATLTTAGIGLFREEGDRKDLPIDFRFLDLLLRAAEDPEVGLGKFALGVRVGPGVRMPRLPALYRPKRKWRLASQADPLEYLEEDASAESTWRRNYASVGELTKQVLEVMDDQARRGQLIKLSEAEAKARFPNLVVASLGANRKDKPGVALTARVLFDGTHGLKLNTRTRIRDQERAPISSDLKRAMREKARQGISTFALTADVSEAHRQIPVHPQDWHLLGCQVTPGADVYVNTVGTFGVSSASYYWGRVASAIGRLAQYIAGDTAQTWHMLVADDYHLEAGGQSIDTTLYKAAWESCGAGEATTNASEWCSRTTSEELNSSLKEVDAVRVSNHVNPFRLRNELAADAAVLKSTDRGDSSEFQAIELLFQLSEIKENAVCVTTLL